MPLTIRTVFAPTDVSSSEDVNKNFDYDPDDSMAHLRGYLDSDDFTVDIGNSIVKRRSFLNGGMVSRTANHDYFNSLFTGADPSGGNDPDDGYHPIVGASAHLNIPRAASMCLFMWSITSANDTDQTGEGPHFHFRYEGTRSVGSRRRAPPAIITVTGPAIMRVGRTRDRVYSGHHMEVSPTKGWKDCGLYVSAKCNQTRLRVASLKWFWIV